MSPTESDTTAVVIGGGFAGVTAAYDLAQAGFRVKLFESNERLGGISGSVQILDKVTVEKFYHHWFLSDHEVLGWIKEIGAGHFLQAHNPLTTFLAANATYQLSTPIDLLRFTPLPFADRVRTGLLTLYARSIKNWHNLEKYTAREWLIKYGGIKSYKIIWEPLLVGKFGQFADRVSATWIWSRLTQRGASRNNNGKESLIYFSGGFNTLFQIVHQTLINLGVGIFLGSPVIKILVENNSVKGVVTNSGFVPCHTVLCTTPLPVFSSLIKDVLIEEMTSWKRIQFIANICLILVLSKPLSNAYWTNISDNDFPFVVVVEHTNFENSENYNGYHIVYLSCYVGRDSHLYQMKSHELVTFTLPRLKKLFPNFDDRSVVGYHASKEPFSQPVNTVHYSTLTPPNKLPIKGLWLSTMAQVYPEGRSTNVIVKHARRVARQMVSEN